LLIKLQSGITTSVRNPRRRRRLAGWPTEKLVAHIKMKDVKNFFSKDFKFWG
jgi:hypothetical protein